MAEVLNNREKQEAEKNPYGDPEKNRDLLAEKEQSSESKESSSLDIDEISKKAEKIAKSSEDIKLTNEGNDDNKRVPSHTTYHGYDGKQTIRRIQKHLKPVDRQFSKVIHNSSVEAVSDVVGATIARPSGLMWGGLLSLLSSFGLYAVSKHYGYEYSYFVGLMFFVGGFVFGLIIEAVLKIFRKKQ